MAVKRWRARKRASSAMARPSGRQGIPKRRRFFRTRRRFGWTWIRRLPLFWMAAVALCAGLLYYLIGSGAFTVRTVVARNIAPREMAAIVARCGCIGRNIFTLRSDAIQQRLQQIPTLDVRRIYTRLPDQVIVDAAYKQRVAVWQTPEASYAVDTAGEVLQVWKRPFPHFRPLGLPVFREDYDANFQRGKRLLVGDRVPTDALNMALSLYQHVPPALQAQVKQYYYRPFIGVTLIGQGKWWALFGMDSSPAMYRRIAMLQAALSSDPPKLRSGYCIDLRAYLYERHDHRCGL